MTGPATTSSVASAAARRAPSTPAQRGLPTHRRAARVDATQGLLLGCAALFVFIVCGPGEIETLGLGGLGRLFWLLADIATVLAIVAGNAALKRHLAENPFLLAWPALAIASALWSRTPGISLYHGLQLLLTIGVGFALGAVLPPRRALLALALGLGVAGMASLAIVAVRPAIGLGIDGTWIGVFAHKNQLGGFMVVEILTCVILVADGRYRAVGFAFVVPAVVCLLGSRSGTALVALVLALLPIPMILAYRRGVVALGVAAGLLASGLAAFVWSTASGSGSIEGTVLAGLGKDETMSGRTILWQFGIDQIRSEPILGIGYKAYWEAPGVSTAAYLRYVIGQDLWFFHNNFIDVGVAFGTVGLIVFVGGMLAAFVRVLSIYAAETSALNLWRIMFLIFVTVQATAENPLFQNHSLLQLLLAVAVARPIWPSRRRFAAGAGSP